MKQIGNRIRTMRRNKNLTQQQLAEALGVSSQSVSKWENGFSAPDVSMLPVIARYFGITIDELFNYRLDVLSYKERFIRFMMDNGMLRFGEYVLHCGRVSPYLIHSGYYRSGSQISKLGEFYAECIRHNSIEGNRLIGNADPSVWNATREIPIVVSTGMMLYDRYGFDANYCIDIALESDGDHPESMTLINDSYTTGNTLRTTLDQIKHHFGKYPTDIVISVDRMEKSGFSALTATHEIEREYGVKIHSIVTVKDIISAIEKGVIPGAEYLEAIMEYTNAYMGV